MFDSFYIGFLNYLKPRIGKKSISFALHYINICEISFYALLACFFGAFSSQLNIVKISVDKAVIIVVLCIAFIIGKNWMRYNGKRRTILNAKSKKHKLPLWKLIAVPVTFIILSTVFYQAI